MKTVAADYEGRAARQRDEASAIQDCGDREHGRQHVRALSQTSKLDARSGPAASTRSSRRPRTEAHGALLRHSRASYTRATQLYRQISAANPKDLLVLQLLGERGVPVARQPDCGRRLARA